MNTPPVYTDFNQFAELRRDSQTDSSATLEKVAKQFESMFIQMMLKNMRSASLGDDIFGSEQMDFYRDMYDQQLALHMSSQKGLGLASTLLQQLSPYAKQKQAEPQQAGDPERMITSLEKKAVDTAPHPAVRIPAPVNTTTVSQPVMVEKEKVEFDDAEDFVSRILPLAKQAADELGISARTLVAQAALETGWGKKIIRLADGTSSFNLFNIKAGKNWASDSVNRLTLEYDRGTLHKQKDNFRVYSSFEESFDDYVALIRDNQRYRDALQVDSDHDYLHAIHKAGYATDPRYVDKIMNIMQRSDFAAVADDMQNAEYSGKKLS